MENNILSVEMSYPKDKNDFMSELKAILDFMRIKDIEKMILYYKSYPIPLDKNTDPFLVEIIHNLLHLAELKIEENERIRESAFAVSDNVDKYYHETERLKILVSTLESDLATTRKANEHLKSRKDSLLKNLDFHKEEIKKLQQIIIKRNETIDQMKSATSASLREMDFLKNKISDLYNEAFPNNFA